LLFGSSLCFIGGVLGFMIAVLDYVLDLMDISLKFRKRGLERPPKPYIKSLVLKELCKVSLRYARGLSLA
jgi:hypothetical protein